MKITKRHLRRIIKEEKAKLKEYGGRPYDPTAPGDFDRARNNPTGDAPPGGDFDAKLEKMADEIGDRAAGGYEPSMDGSPEAYADHILDVYLQNPPPPLDQMEDLEYVLTKPMYRKQVKNAVLEYIGMMTEGKKIKVTKRQLRRIILETLEPDDRDYSAPPGEEDYYAPGGEGEQATDAQLKKGWSVWLEERGLEFEDLDDLALAAGAPNRTWLDAIPPNDGFIGPLDVEVWVKDMQAAKEILSTRTGDYSSTTLPGGKKIGEGTLPDDMPDSWRQILGNCLEDKS